MKAFGWSLYEIDRTDIESLLPFVMHAAITPGEGRPEIAHAELGAKKQLFCDQVKWL